MATGQSGRGPRDRVGSLEGPSHGGRVSYGRNSDLTLNIARSQQHALSGTKA